VTKSLRRAVIAAMLVTGCTNAASSTGDRLLTKTRDRELPGNASRYDYAAVAPVRHFLYLAHLGASEVVVVDLAEDTAPTVVKGLVSVHGVIAPVTTESWFATATGTNEVVALSVGDNVEQWRVKVGSFPDGLGFDERGQVLAVSNKNDGSVSLIALKDGKPSTSKTVNLGKETGNVAFDPTTNAFLVAVTPSDSLALVTSTGERVGSVALRGCKGAHGVATAVAEQLAVVACEKNSVVAVVDLVSLKQIAVLKVGSGPDVLAYDPNAQRIYVAAESGPTTVIGVERGAATVLGNIDVGKNAHTVAVDSSTSLAYFALRNEAGRAVLREMVIPNDDV
jgi:DNA-binding beta-propeller fold protein YncE